MSRSRKEHHRALVNYLPGGRLYSSALREGSNLYNFLFGLAQELKTSGDYVEDYRVNILPDSKPRTLIASVAGNELDFPRDLTGWTQVGTAVSAYDAVGIDNVENRATTLTDDDGAAFELVQEDITIPDDSNTHTFSIFIKKDSDTSRAVGIDFIFNGGTNQQNNINFNTSSGLITDRSIIGTATAISVDQGDFWRVILTLANNTSGNISAAIRVYASIHTVVDSPGASASATGSCITDYATFELNTDTPSDVFDEAIGTDYGFIEEWEDALGIQDDCFPGDVLDSFELRRTHVLAKLASLGIQTEQDFIDLAVIFGITATIAQIGKFTIEITTDVVEIIAFPLVFPIPFSVSQTGVYQCLVTKLKPANCDIVFVTL